MSPPANDPIAQPQAKMAIRVDAVRSEKPISCSHMVKKTIAFQGVVPTIPCTDTPACNTFLLCMLPYQNFGQCYAWNAALGAFRADLEDDDLESGYPQHREHIRPHLFQARCHHWIWS